MEKVALSKILHIVAPTGCNNTAGQIPRIVEVEEEIH